MNPVGERIVGRKDQPAPQQSKEARALRIYEYMDDSGVVFWSLTRLPGVSVRHLTLGDSRGTYFRTHIAEIHRLVMESGLAEEE